MEINNGIRYIDLFAGIGGFHQAMDSLGGKCIFASEIDSYAIETYYDNYGIDANHDITTIDPKDIEPYEMLCAGFPCQAFSKAGKQEGFNDETKGTLFFHIERLLRHRYELGNPVKYFVLENVANLVSHDHGNTWKVIKTHLKNLEYIITEDPIILSPHQFGIPQLRNRVFILGVHKSYVDTPEFQEISIDKNNLPPLSRKHNTSIYDIIDTKENSNTELSISDMELEALEIWEEFYKSINEKVIGFPIWADFMKLHPEEYSDYPSWKINFIEKNIELYQKNKSKLDQWFKRHNNLSHLPGSYRKFEWQAGNYMESLFDGVIQFRPSGIRVKRPTEFPALVAMVHIPIIGKFRRRLSVREAARLQSFPNTFIINKNSKQAYKQFGNSVNITVVKFVINELFKLKLT